MDLPGRLTPESPACSHRAVLNDRHAEFLAIFLASEKEIFRYISALAPSGNDAQDLLQQTALAMSHAPGEGHLVTFDVWECKITEPGEVTLGPPNGPEGWKNWMYGIAARPLETQGH